MTLTPLAKSVSSSGPATGRSSALAPIGAQTGAQSAAQTGAQTAAHTGAPPSPGPAPAVLRPEAQARTAGWVLRRALIGIVVLVVFVAGAAVLLHATIEPEGAGQTSAEE